MSGELRSRFDDGGRGFSLIELVASMAVLAVLMAAVGSTVLLASRAVPGEDAAVVHVTAAARVLEQISAELETAIEVKTVDIADLVFTVADRDGDGQDETVRYRWAGPGEPLTRRFGDGAEVTMLDAVQTFEVAAEVRTVTDDTDAPLIEGEEVEVLSRTSLSHGTGAKVSIDTGIRVAEAILPDLPDASAWKPTRLAFVLDPVKSTRGVLNIAVRPPSLSGSPDDSIAYDTVAVNESDLTAGNWHMVAVNVSEPLPTDQNLFACLEFVSGAVAAEAWTGTTSTVDSYRDTGTGNWTAINAGLWIYAWGVPLVPDPAWEGVSVSVLERVALTLDAGGTDRTTVKTAVGLLNQPGAP